MGIRGRLAGHAVLRRWAIKISPVLSAVPCWRVRPVGKRRHRVGTKGLRPRSSSVAGEDLLRATDHCGRTSDILLSLKRDIAARRVMEHAIAQHVPRRRSPSTRAAAGLRQVKVHDLKQPFGRLRRAAGANFEDNQDLLGHRPS
jgi:transposase-like protein